MANKYAEDIRQIVGVDGTKSAIDAPKPKKPISGKRGIAWFNSDGTIGSGSGSSGGSGSATIQPDDADDGTGNSTGSTGGGGGGSTGSSGVTQDDTTTPATTDATGLFNNIVVGAAAPSEITGMFDCTTSQEYTVRTDGQFTAPDGWDDAESPPIDDDYETEFYWNVLNNGSPEYIPWRSSTPDQVWSNTGYDLLYRVLWEPGYYRYYYNRPGFGVDQIGIYRYSCGASTSDYCTVVPYDTEWPTDSPAQLTYEKETQTWNTSTFDSNVADEYKTNNASQIELCDSNGDVLQIQPSTNGGLVYTNANDNIFFVRGPDGKITAAGSGSARDMYVAK